MIFSEDVGVAKPDPGIFRVLLDRTGVPAEDSAYVGDSLRDDIAGARRAGMHSIWLNRSGAPNTTGIVPDAEVRSLAEVPDVLEVWSGGS